MKLFLILYLLLYGITITTTTTFVPDWQTVSSVTTPYLLHDGWILYSDDNNNNNNNNNPREHIHVPSLPNDLWTILYHVGKINDPYYDRNFLTQRHIWMGPTNESTRKQYDNNNNNNNSTDGLEIRSRIWILERWMKELEKHQQINHTTTTSSLSYILVVESIKMGAIIEVDGVVLERVTNQFLRYTIPIPVNAKLIKIIFDPKISTDGRFMACSGGWDWAPYTKTGDGRGSRTGTLGVIQPIYLLPVPTLHPFMIHAVVPKIYYVGSYPTNPLYKANFTVHVDVHLDWLPNSTTTTTLHEHAIWIKTDFTNKVHRILVTSHQWKVTVVFDAQNVNLWWPHGMGEQPLYHIYTAIDYHHHHHSSLRWIKQRIGFRIVAMVTTDDTNSNEFQQTKNRQGSGDHGMFFRVNGAIVNCRGANMVPMDIMEGRWTPQAHRLVVQSAVRANMNMIRVWGGGAVLPKTFYDTCDEMGVLVYHDLMFVGEQNHSAFRTKSIEKEIRHIVRKLSSHPSIILWSGCNECDYFDDDMSIYETFVLATVASEDDSRAIWPSSPSTFGWETGVDKVYGKPNGRSLKIRKAGNHTLEVHGPYLRGYSDSYPGVNGFHDYDSFDMHIPPQFQNQDENTIGPKFPNVFVSEFGASGSSSFESLSATLLPSTWSLHGGSDPDTCEHVIGSLNTCNGTNVMAERNYPCDSLIEAFFGHSNVFDVVGDQAFSISLYQCMISQALWMKGQIEVLRFSNSYGILIWQLNEIWPTGGWGAVEYGSNCDAHQQVVGGRWKPLMYLLQQTLYKDLLVACGNSDGSVCYVRNDSLNASNNIQIHAEAWCLNSIQPLATKDFNFHATAVNPLAMFHLPKEWTSKADVVMLTASECSPGSLGNCTASIGNSNLFLWKTPLELSAKITSQPLCQIRWDDKTCEEYLAQQNLREVSFTFECDHLMLYVFLATSATGTFDINAFHVKPHEEKQIVFKTDPSAGFVDLDLFQRSLRFHHLFSRFEDSNIVFNSCLLTVDG